MNKKLIAQNIGHVLRLRPTPIVKKDGKPIKESLNSWTFIDFPKEERLVFHHSHSQYKVSVEAGYVRGHEPPDMIVVRGQLFLEDNSKFSFEPFTEGMASGDPRELTDDPSGKLSHQIYDALKPHEGKEVSIRFPRSDDGTEYGGHEAVLEEVTPHYVKLRIPPLTIALPDWAKNIEEMSDRTFPGYEKSVALKFLALEEDVTKKRPLLVMDYQHWGKRFS